MTETTYLLRANGSGVSAHIQAGDGAACGLRLGGSTKAADWIAAVALPDGARLCATCAYAHSAASMVEESPVPPAPRAPPVSSRRNPVMTVGQYEGEPMADIPDDYLRWALVRASYMPMVLLCRREAKKRGWDIPRNIPAMERQADYRKEVIGRPFVFDGD